MEFLIRECTLEDYLDIALLNKNELGYDYPTQETQNNLLRLLNQSEHKILVAVASEKVVGYIHANDYNLLYGPPLKNIMGIAVSSDFKKMGKMAAELILSDSRQHIEVPFMLTMRNSL